MKAYIHKTVWSETAGCDIKTAVPDAMMRRRMSRIVRDGVMAAALCAEGREVDAIITATAYGCLADSEKFLRTLLETNEELLSPTSFIQSTFNTVGATIALLQQRHCYNTTYAHGAGSFAAALLDGVMQIEEQRARCVLIGAVEEVTPTLQLLLERMRVRKTPQQGEAFFFLLSAEAEGACAEIQIQACDTPEQEGYCDPLAVPRELYNAICAGENRTFATGGLKINLL